MLRSKPYCYCILSILGLFAFSLQVTAEPDILEFKTGDVIRGELLRIEDGVVYFQSPVFGEIAVSEEEIEQITVTEADAPVAEPAAPVAVEDSQDLPGTRGRWWSDWSGRFDLGVTFQSGRSDRSEASVRAQAEREIERNHYRATAEYLYGKQDGSKSTDNYGADFRWRRTLDQNFYFQTLTSYEVDNIRLIRHRAEQNAMVGYQYLKTDRMDASIGPGATVQYNEVRGDPDRWHYLATGFQDFNWRFAQAYRFEQDSTILIEPNDTDNYIYRFNAGIIGTLTDNINLSIRYNFLYENQPASGIDRQNHRLITSIGYAF